MSISQSLQISASGLTAERLRMDVISNNLANINTTSTPEGTPYRRRHVVFEAMPGNASFASTLRTAAGGPGAPGAAIDAQVGGGVAVVGIEPDTGPFKHIRDPDNPGQYIDLPNIEPVMEMVDLISASRAYDAGITAIGAAKQMQQRALDIGKG